MEALISVILLVIAVGGAVGIAIKAASVVLLLGDLGDIFVRVPQNTVLAIMRHRKLIKLLAATSQKIDSNNKESLEFIKGSQGGLKFMGPSFLGYEVYEWYETPENEKDGINALHSIDLAEQVIKYLPQDPKMKKDGEKIIPVDNSEHDPINGVPSFKSADNIEIRTSLAVFFVVKDPEKALFSIRYRKKAIREQIFPLWRDVLGEFSFFVYENVEEAAEKGKKSATVINPTIKTASNETLRERLGLPAKDTGGEVSGLAKKIFLDRWGMEIKDVTVGDMDAADPEIEDALGEQMKARTKALAAIEISKGQEEAQERVGIGKRKMIENIIAGFIGGNKNKVSEAIEAAVAWRQFEAMENMPKEGRQLFYQWPTAVKTGPHLADFLKNLDPEILEKIIKKIKQ